MSLFQEDPYLNVGKVFERLLNEYRKYGKLIIAYDFDDTVYDFHGNGSTYNQVISLLKRWKGKAIFIVFTASSKERYDEIKRYLNDNEIPYDYINENPPDMDIPRGSKIYYNALLDDRAGLKTIYDALTLVIKTIETEEEKKNGRID